MKKLILLVAILFTSVSANDLQLKAGLTKFKISDSKVDTVGLNIGFHYDLINNIGVGFSYDRAEDSGSYSSYTYDVKEQLFLGELFIKMPTEKTIVKPTIILGNLKETVSTTEPNVSFSDRSSVYGIGAYMEIESFSLFIKKMKINNELGKNINLIGVQYLF